MIVAVLLLCTAVCGAADQKDKYPEQFTVQASGSDANGCWTNFKTANQIFATRELGGGLFDGPCWMLQPGTVVSGRFYSRHSWIEVQTNEKGKAKVERYEILQTMMLPQ
jgi:hypothetical protein